MLHLKLLEADLIPDWLIRMAIRRGLRQRLRQWSPLNTEEKNQRKQEFIAELDNSPIAADTDAANAQHYEVPADFFCHVLGKHLKYSCGHWDPDCSTLDQAEESMLRLSCLRGEIADGQAILDLGCGWGSLSLWICRQFPNAQVLAVSNSRLQREFIESRCQTEGIRNLEVVTCDINEFAPAKRFDRVVSIEMFEHVKNYRRLLSQISDWLEPDGKLFVHIFVHGEYAYPFEASGSGNWMARTFFTGGNMPSADLLLNFQDQLRVVKQWRVGGEHYQKTAEAWLEKMDGHKQEIRALFERHYGARQARGWFVNWRVFFMACAELWGFDGGSEWFVSHYLFEPVARQAEFSNEIKNQAQLPAQVIVK